MNILKFFYCVYATLVFYIIWQPLILVFFIMCMINRKIIPVPYQLFIKFLFLLMFKLIHVEGKEKIDYNKRYIIYFNHSCFLDPCILLILYPEIAWVAKERSINLPFYGFFLKLCDCVPILSDKSNRIAVFNEQLERILKKNCSLGIAPEGERTLDGQIKPFKKGIFHMINNSDLDILPVTMNGFYTFKSKYQKYINPNIRLELIVHKPIENAFLKFKDKNFVLSELRDIIQKDYHLCRKIRSESNYIFAGI